MSKILKPIKLNLLSNINMADKSTALLDLIWDFIVNDIPGQLWAKAMITTIQIQMMKMQEGISFLSCNFWTFLNPINSISSGLPELSSNRNN